MVKHLLFSYQDVMNMPTYERRFYIEKHREFMEMQNGGAPGPTSTGKGQRSTSYTPGINGPKV